ncbi:MAG: DUF4340 domain-containing protein [Deltaproteobacteria bacterium]|nr:DUF4340 domain-containing protein [Deltaproteobacteria bacterium]
MRFFKKTVFWVIALAVVGGSFYLIDRQLEEKKVVEEAKKRLFPFEPGDIIEFQITRGNENIILRKEGSDWFLENPLRAVADKEVVQKLLDAVINAKFEATLFETQSEGKLKEMGIIGKDSLSATFKASSGLIKTIVFGDRNPTMNLGFAILKDDPRIFRLTADIKAEADKTVYDLRDKTALAFKPLKIKGFEIKWSDGKIIAVDHPGEGKWHIVKPKNAAANAIKITELLYRIKDSKVKAFIDESPKDLAGYGLSRPALKFSVTDDKGKQIALLVGEKDKKQRGIFAKRGDAPNVFLLEEDFMVNMPKTAEELEETEVEQATKK